jgi:DNA-binding response OmpR family regulator
MSAAAAPGARHACILLVDDDESGRLLLRLALENEGYEVIDAPTAELGLERVRDEEINAAIIDAVLPGMDGFEMCRRMRAAGRYRTLPIMILTGLEDPGYRSRADEAGADAFIYKSHDWCSFTCGVRRLLMTERP